MTRWATFGELIKIRPQWRQGQLEQELMLLSFVWLCLDTTHCLTFDAQGLVWFALYGSISDSGGWHPVAGGVAATVNQGPLASGFP